MENRPVGVVGALVPRPAASVAACCALRAGRLSFSHSRCPLLAVRELPAPARRSRDVSAFPTGAGSPAGTGGASVGLAPKDSVSEG